MTERTTASRCATISLDCASTGLSTKWAMDDADIIPARRRSDAAGPDTHPDPQPGPPTSCPSPAAAMQPVLKMPELSRMSLCAQDVFHLHGGDEARQVPIRIRTGHQIYQLVRLQQLPLEALRHAAQHAQHGPPRVRLPPLPARLVAVGGAGAKHCGASGAQPCPDPLLGAWLLKTAMSAVESAAPARGASWATTAEVAACLR